MSKASLERLLFDFSKEYLKKWLFTCLTNYDNGKLYLLSKACNRALTNKFGARLSVERTLYFTWQLETLNAKNLYRDVIEIRGCTRDRVARFRLGCQLIDG